MFLQFPWVTSSTRFRVGMTSWGWDVINQSCDLLFSPQTFLVLENIYLDWPHCKQKHIPSFPPPHTHTHPQMRQRRTKAGPRLFVAFQGDQRTGPYSPWSPPPEPGVVARPLLCCTPSQAPERALPCSPYPLPLTRAVQTSS